MTGIADVISRDVLAKFLPDKRSILAFEQIQNSALGTPQQLSSVQFLTFSPNALVPGALVLAASTGIGFDTSVPGELKLNVDQLTVPRTISMSGDVIWTVSFDGSADVSAVGALSLTGVVPGAYTLASVQVDADGRISAIADGSPYVLPTPTASTLGGVKSLASAANKFLTSIDLTGTPTSAQPTSADILATATNNNAVAGIIGEFIEATLPLASAVSLTNGVSANVVSISLTAGDWDVWGQLTTNPAGTTNTTVVSAGISTTSATVPTAPNGGAVANIFPTSIGLLAALPTGSRRLSLATTTTVYLVVSAFFNSGALAAYGYLGGRRAR